MMPAGPFDGGRFFYLGVLSVTKSEKISKAASRLAGMFILMIFVLLMVLWFFGLF
jgi:membrane-associated protease RseP (regulator of RpoE activity)